MRLLPVHYTVITLLPILLYSTFVSAQTSLHDLSAIKDFLNCLGSSKEQYKLNLDEGEILVLPAAGRHLNATQQDNTLVNCIAESNSHINVVMYGSAYEDDTVSSSSAADQLVERLDRYGISTIPRRRPRGGFALNGNKEL
ncbi:hypothetical protein I204_00827 [Kwoniella mangroviensis CBS 8886]|nr:hypothetical protein I204_00827 [Kwoniella mangroviensis CBS 8886]